MNGDESNDANSSCVQGVCPEGWHIPSDAEWIEFILYLGINAGGKLKEAGTTYWQSPNEGVSNEGSFTALPGGYRDINGYFYSFGAKGSW